MITRLGHTVYGLPFIVKDGSGNPVTGILDANFVKAIRREGQQVADIVTVTERQDIANGYYQATYVPSAVGHDILIISHATYGVLSISRELIVGPQYGQPSIWENLP